MIRALAGAGAMALSQAAGGALAQSTIELSEESLLAANAVTSSSRISQTLSRLTFHPAFDAFDLSVAGDDPVKVALSFFLETPGDAQARTSLMQALEAAGETNELNARAWFELALQSARNSDFDALDLEATRARDTAAAIDNPEAVSNALMLRGIMFLFSNNGFPSRHYLEAAVNHFSQAIFALPPSKEPFLSSPHMWDAFAWLKAAQRAGLRLGYGEISETTMQDSASASAWFYRQPTTKQCGLKWKKLAKLKYDKKAYESGYTGAIVVGYDLNKRLKPVNAVVLASVPDDRFAKNALGVIRGSRKIQQDGRFAGNAACSEDRFTVIYFDHQSRPFGETE